MAGYGKRTPEQRQAMAERSRLMWQDPVFRATTLAGMREAGLPRMPAAKAKLYAQLRRKGLDREAAVAEAMR
jgi:hypothetical protein